MPRIKWHNFDSYAYDTLEKFKRDSPSVVAIDTETTGFAWNDRPFGVSIAWFEPVSGRIKRGWFELDDGIAARHCGTFFDIIEERKVQQIYFNAKFDIRMLINIGMLKGWPEYWDDVLIPVAYTRPNGKRGLKDAARDLLLMNTNEDEVLKQVRKELKLTKDDGYWPIPREYIIPYAEKDAEMTLRLCHYFTRQGWYDKWEKCYHKELTITRILTEMEFAGLKVKREQLKAEIRRSDDAIQSARIRISSYVGKPIGKNVKAGEFNPGSHLQVKQWVKDTYDITLPDTTSGTLAHYLDRIPMLGSLAVLKKEEKLNNTYLKPILSELDQYDVLHPNWKQFGTNTGRFSSSGDVDG